MDERLTMTSRVQLRVVLLSSVACAVSLAPSEIRAQQAGAVALEQITVETSRESPTGPVQGYVATRPSPAPRPTRPFSRSAPVHFRVTRDQMDARGRAECGGEALNYNRRLARPALRRRSTLRRAHHSRLRCLQQPVSQRAEADAHPGLRSPSSNMAWSASTCCAARHRCSMAQGNPGGLIDMISKRATFTNFGEVQAISARSTATPAAFDIGGVLGTRFLLPPHRPCPPERHPDR